MYGDIVAKDEDLTAFKMYVVAATTSSMFLNGKAIGLKRRIKEHLENLSRLLENHDELLFSSDPDVQEKYSRLMAQFWSDREVIDGLAPTAEGFLGEAAKVLGEASIRLNDRGVGIAGIVVRYIG